MQSNGTLLNDAWCRFIKAHNISIGLSIDGPAAIHDVHRRTRSGRGSHEAAMRGLRLLQANEIPFHVISVITRQSFGRAEEIYHFIAELGVSHLGINIEEIEADNQASTLDSSAAVADDIRTR